MDHVPLHKKIRRICAARRHLAWKFRPSDRETGETQ